MDFNGVHVGAFVGLHSGKSLTPLIKYISAQKNHDFGPLIVALKNVDQLPNEKEKAIQLVNTLLPYRNLLRNEEKQDTVIVFVEYGIKQPSNLSQILRARIANLVRQFDTTERSAEFDSGKCPQSFLMGNINIYPLALENTFWHNIVEFNSPKEAPILEIRFMGLKGIFRYFLDEMTARTGDSFFHLDGHSL